MRAYIDSSVLLRKIFAEPNPLEELAQIKSGIASELIRVECLRTANRYHLANKEPNADFVKRLELIHHALNSIELVRITSEILNRASQPFPTVIGTLDAIHLATCLLYAERRPTIQKDLFFCTHDKALKNAASAMGLRVLG
jgi:predicted nucleic acid-binding protein